MGNKPVPVKVKAMSFGEMLGEVQRTGEKVLKEFEESGGKCVGCHKNMANRQSLIDPYRCDECNNKTEKLLKELRGTPGFVEMRMPIERK